jgi:hypothetical protein
MKLRVCENVWVGTQLRQRHPAACPSIHLIFAGPTRYIAQSAASRLSWHFGKTTPYDDVPLRTTHA